MPSTATDNQTFAVVDSARVQLIPMAFVNYRVGCHKSAYYGKKYNGQKRTNWF